MFWVSVKRHDLIEYPSGDEKYFTHHQKHGKKSSPLTSKQLPLGPTLPSISYLGFRGGFFMFFESTFCTTKMPKWRLGTPNPSSHAPRTHSNNKERFNLWGKPGTLSKQICGTSAEGSGHVYISRIFVAFSSKSMVLNGSETPNNHELDVWNLVNMG